MDIRLIATDLDGTLLHDDKSVSAYTKQTLARAADDGIPVAIATGRPLMAIPEHLISMDCFSYAITSNGASVYDLKTGERLMERILSREASLRILEAIPEDTCVETLVDGIPYGPEAFVRDAGAFGLNESGADYIRRTRRPVGDIRAFIRENAGRLDCINAVPPSPQRARALQERLSEIPGIYVTHSGATFIEISATLNGKGDGITFLSGFLKIPVEAVMVFGDGENDRDLFRAAGYGVAMGNADAALIREADAVTCTNEQDGVAVRIAGMFGYPGPDQTA